MEVLKTRIEGLLQVELDVHGDDRGWFKESYQREKLMAAGVPGLDAVQNNVSFNAERGVVRGIHAEPWNKWVSVAHGTVFAAIVDLRPGALTPSGPVVETFELGVGQALYIPRGCGNSYCTLTPDVVYNYLVDAHWSPQASYVLVNPFDPVVAIDWPVPRAEMIVSEKDLGHPFLAGLAGLDDPVDNLADLDDPAEGMA